MDEPEIRIKDELNKCCPLCGGLSEVGDFIETIRQIERIMKNDHYYDIKDVHFTANRIALLKVKLKMFEMGLISKKEGNNTYE